MTQIIGIQGIKGSFCEQAAHIFTKNHEIESYKIEYLVGAEPVFQAIENESTHYGILAVENAQGGVVIETLLALAKYRSDIVEMFHINISQNLMALEKITLGQVTEVHSHQQALGQCSDYLKEHFWSRPLIESKDTALAAKDLQSGKICQSAAIIGNEACAELYGLKILEKNIQDLKNNLTLFFAVKKLR